jgi:hypothetical protein
VSKIHPYTDKNPVSSHIILKQHYLCINDETLSKYGITGIRKKLAMMVKNTLFFSFSAIATCLYTLLIIAILALENEIYDSPTSVSIIDISEIILASIFAIEAGL